MGPFSSVFGTNDISGGPQVAKTICNSLVITYADEQFTVDNRLWIGHYDSQCGHQVVDHSVADMLLTHATRIFNYWALSLIKEILVV